VESPESFDDAGSRLWHYLDRSHHDKHGKSDYQDEKNYDDNGAHGGHLRSRELI
jgi:hypothetical protein